MEIERKFLIRTLPENLEQYPFHLLEQAYLCTDPTVRVRQSDDTFYLTYKSQGLLSREEYNLPLTAESYAHLKAKADGNIIRKKRYLIPVSAPNPAELTIELDVFEAPFDGLMLAEVEFTSEEQAQAFVPPAWFGEDVTYSLDYHNSTLSQKKF
ncbi:MAG: CYTH domain-containing protein [Lachnospiraceae bacterium]|nr:CYTH domain-containing protein [Lachnospiraceae bacterium]